MSQIRIATDSTCDLPEARARALGITVVPVVVNFGDETFTDFDLTNDEFWVKTEQICHPRSSQPPVGAFVEGFKPLVDSGHDVICVTVTGKLSGSYNAAWTAAQDFGGHVTVVDSQALSLGLGFQVLAAQEAAESGRSVDEILEHLASIRLRSHIHLLFDTIEFLERGGRASRVMPAIKRVVGFLNIKPLLYVSEGELKLAGGVRSYQKGLRRLTDQVSQLGSLERLGVLHIRRPDLAQQVAVELAEVASYPSEEVMVVEAGPGLSCHGGPGVMGFAAISRM
jgi:DegV family protein with EDD domain